MSVSNVGSAAGNSQVHWRSSVREARQDFKQLFQAMQSGDLSGAQQAYSALQQLQANNATSNATGSDAAGGDASTTTAGASTSSTATAGNPIASDWSALGQALQSGNLTSAQSSFSQLEQDLQAKAQGAGHHHRHHRDIDETQAANPATQVGNANGAAGTASSGAVASDISALQKALQSGDTSSAQTLLTQLQNDLQASGQVPGQGHHHRHRGFATQSPVAAYSDPAVSGTGAAVPATTATGSGSSATA